MDNLPNRVFLKILRNQLEVLVGRCIIDNYYFVVGIVLIENRAKVILISEILSVIQGWHYNTEGHFWQIEVMFFTKPFILCFEESINLFFNMYVLVD